MTAESSASIPPRAEPNSLRRAVTLVDHQALLLTYRENTSTL